MRHCCWRRHWLQCRSDHQRRVCARVLALLRRRVAAAIGESGRRLADGLKRGRSDERKGETERRGPDFECTSKRKRAHRHRQIEKKNKTKKKTIATQHSNIKTKDRKQTTAPQHSNINKQAHWVTASARVAIAIALATRKAKTKEKKETKSKRKGG